MVTTKEVDTLKQYKIGDVAKLLGITPQALRFYEQEGIVIPPKTKNGTRYFTTSEIVRLLAFKKYQHSDFTVQDVATHFKQGSLNDLTLKLDEQSDKLIAQSELLLRRARAIRSFERILRQAQMEQGRIVPERRPMIYLQNLSFNELTDLNSTNRAMFLRLSGAMPETGIYFLPPHHDHITTEFYLGATPETAENWSIPPDDLTPLAPADCVRIYMRSSVLPWQEEPIQALLSRVRAAGFTPDNSQPIIGKHLASETIKNTVYLYAVFWVPICEN